MGWTIGVLGFNSRRELGIFLFTTASRSALGPTYPLSNGTREFFPWVSSGRGVKLTTHLHLVPRSRMRGSIPPLANIFVAWCLVKRRDNFTFYLYLNVLWILCTEWCAENNVKVHLMNPWEQHYIHEYKNNETTATEHGDNEEINVMSEVAIRKSVTKLSKNETTREDKPNLFNHRVFRILVIT
jgi:hypothetical protein